MPDEATEALLDDHATSYATSGRVAWHASYAEPDVVEMSYVWGVTGNPSELLTLALPHHAVWKSNFGPPRAIDAMLSP